MSIAGGAAVLTRVGSSKESKRIILPPDTLIAAMDTDFFLDPVTHAL